MVGLSDFGLYQRKILVFHGKWTNCVPGERYSNKVPMTEPLISVAMDLQQKIWVCRGKNWQLARSSFIGALSGTTRKEWADVYLVTPKGDILINQYFMNDSPRRQGVAFRNFNPDRPNLYAQRTDRWGFDDPALMSPIEKMADMFDRAVRSDKLKSIVREQLGSIISPEVLLPLAGTF